MNRTLVSPESAGLSASRLARIRPVMQSYVDAKGYSGMCTLLARGGHIVHWEQVGWQDRENKLPLTADTIYRIYSMTKPVVCTALMTLYEQGAFLLNEPLAKYLPAFGKVKVMDGVPPYDTLVDPLRPIAIRDLMTHTSGLTYNFLEDSPVCDLYRQASFMRDSSLSLEAVVDEIATLPLAFQPGARWHYSMGIDVAARLIEVLAGQSLQDFLKTHLFDPLGMLDTGFSVPPEKRAQLSPMFGNPDIATHTFSQIYEAWLGGYNARIQVESTHPCDNTITFARGGHGLFSTAYDYLRFAQMLLQGGELDGARILSPRTVALMHSNHLPASLLPYETGGVANPGYGFGLGSRLLMDPAAAGILGSTGEFGWGGAANTYYWVDPAEQMVGVFMAQYMVSFETPEQAFRAMAYSALVE